ncbi:hypothetical protein P7H19_25585 [Paenibacillus larvae]|nr:hypothetical protein [Paenibacillus larvae]
MERRIAAKDPLNPNDELRN